MTKKQLLEDLRKRTYCRLRVSPIHGVGVFAIRDIPKGVNPFYSCKKAKLIPSSEKEKAHLPKAVQKLINDFCVTRGGKHLIPDFGLNSIDISHYLNHSKKPNLTAVFRSEMDDTEFITARKIKSGEELTSDHETYSEF